MAVDQPPHKLPGVPHLDAGEVLEVTLRRPERDRPWTVEATLVPDSALLEEPGAIPHQAVHAVEHSLPRPGRQAAVGEPRPDVPWEVHSGSEMVCWMYSV